MSRICPDCGANLDPEERCNCGGPVFRLRIGSAVELIDQETYMDILQKMRHHRTKDEARKNAVKCVHPCAREKD